MITCAGVMPDRMKDAGVLIGLTGRHGNVLKFRMPLVTNRSNIDFLIRALDRVLAQAVSERSNASHHVSDGIVTEATVAEFARSGFRMVTIGRSARVTPLASDKARDLGITLSRKRF